MGISITVTILGTSSAIPTLQRSLSSIAITYKGGIYLFDCGEGTQIQLMRSKLKPGRVRGIFISHLHGDHINGLSGLLMSFGLNSRIQPLNLFGPPGIAEYVQVTKRLMGTRFGYFLSIRELEGAQCWEEKNFRVEYRWMKHRMPTLGYAFVEKDRPGTFNVQKARELGIPAGPLYKELQDGRTITLEDGRTIHPTEVLGPPKSGRRITYCADTRPCEECIELARSADILIHDSTFSAEFEEKARLRGHSTARDAAMIAEKAGAKQLILTHFSTRFRDAAILENEAREIFPNTIAGYDLLSVDL
jgi:ribonuclease Z